MNKDKNQNPDQKLKLKKNYEKYIKIYEKNAIITNKESSFLKQFLKYDSITKFKKFNIILEDIVANKNYNKNDKFDSLCKTLYQDLYKYYDTNTKLIDSQTLALVLLESDYGTKFTSDQNDAIENIMDFICNNDGDHFYGLYGYAGTGKTTTVSAILKCLMYLNLVKSVIFAAPTNNVVNLLKAKLSNLINILCDHYEIKATNFDEQIVKLKSKGIKIEFITLHTLLNFKRDFDVNGKMTFIPQTTNSRYTGDVVVIDEISMVPYDLTMNLLNKYNIDNHSSSQNNNYKIILCGDPAQLAPVNESTNIIFRDKKEKINIKSTTLKQIVRSDNKYIIGLSNEVRKWVFNEINTLNLNKFKCDKIKIYRYKNGKKTNTRWFKNYLKTIHDDNDKKNIILSWRNKLIDEYNIAARKAVHHKNNPKKFEIGDLIILQKFYSVNCDDNVYNEKHSITEKLYTSDQVSVVDVKYTTLNILPLTLKINKIIQEPTIIESYNTMLKNINNMIIGEYKIYELTANTGEMNIVKINVLCDSEKNKFKNCNDYINDQILLFRKQNVKAFYKYKDKIDNGVIKSLWTYINNHYINAFANINYGFAITVHKSQGSDYSHVYIDMYDILQNRNQNDAKRCLYTAITRAFDELHLLI